MTLVQAMVILKDEAAGKPPIDPLLRSMALNLGSEALSLLHHQRAYLTRAQETILPGETKENDLENRPSHRNPNLLP